MQAQYSTGDLDLLRRGDLAHCPVRALRERFTVVLSLTFARAKAAHRSFKFAKQRAGITAAIARSCLPFRIHLQPATRPE